MKLLKNLVIIGVFCSFGVACSEQSSITTGEVEKKQSQAPAQVATTAPDEPSEIDGTLTQTEKGLALVTDTKIYILAGQDLSDMLGKKVKITGAIAKVDETQVIQVMSFIPIK